jgi:hypothetical protein
MKYIIIVFLIFFSTKVLPQELSSIQLDSLYNLFTYVKGVSTLEDLQQKGANEPEIIKCGLGLVTSVKQNLSYFTPEQQNVLEKLLLRPVSQKSIVSSNGFFRVHYDTSGNNAIAYDINLFLQALDSVYTFEINYLGYPTPPSDGMDGGDDKYDIYIQNSTNTYGYTTPEQNVASSRWTSFINIDNDFGSGFYTHGIDAARVTAAHEFHHAIQFGNYAPVNLPNAYRGSDVWFYEITSTSFEEFVFDDVNDYYAYMPHYFLNPSKSIVRFESGVDAYDLGIWNLYLQKNFGFDILKNQWERIPTTSAIKAVALSINSFNSTLKYELNNFGIWCYYTGSRAISGRYFDEASFYPLLTPTATMNFNSSSQSYDLNLYPVSNYFLKINLPGSDGVFYTIASNTDWLSVENNNFNMQSGSLSIYHNSTQGEKKLNDNYSVTFSNNDSSRWNNAGILNDVLIYGGSKTKDNGFSGDTRAFPNPYRLSYIDGITLEFEGDLNPNSEADVNIFSSGLELYFAGKKTIAIADKGINQVTISKSEAKFSTGVYIYVIKSGKKIWKGKLVVLND